MRVAKVGRFAALTIGAVLLNLMPPAAAASGFPYRLIRRIELPAAGAVHALLFDPQVQQIYVAQGRRIEGYALSGAPLPVHRRLPGTVSALVRNGAGEIVAAVRAPAEIVFLAPRTLAVEHRHVLDSDRPARLLYDRQANLLFVESRSSGNIVRLDPSSGRSLGRVHLGGALGQMAGNGRGTLYVTNAARGALDVVDADPMRNSGAIPLHRCRAPGALAMDTVGRRLFVGCANDRTLIVDADLGFTFVRLPIPGGLQQQAVFAFHPFGARGWKGGVFFAGASAVAGIQMQAFVRYRDQGHLRLPGRCSALTLVRRVGELWLAVTPKTGGPAVLWVLGMGRSEVR
ncbi:MAG: YncE family protein [Steroidobacteraceae bacterium]